MKILGVSLGHDTNFSLVSDNKIIEIMEVERFFRQKRYKLHALSLDYGRNINGYQYIDLEELDFFLTLIVKSWGSKFDIIAVQNQGRSEEFINFKKIIQRMGIKFYQIVKVDHHLSHAALSFYTSPFFESVILSYDGFGNDGVTIIFHAQKEKGIKYIEYNQIRFGQNYNNLGYMAGIKPDVSGTSSGKTMGLAAYGNMRKEWITYARKYVLDYRKLPYKSMEGLNDYGKGHTINSIGLNEIPELSQYVIEPEGPIISRPDKIKLFFNKRTPKSVIKQLQLPGPEDPITQDLIKTVQAVWTEEVIKILLKNKMLCSNLCIVGGCALNGITNYAIQKKGIFKEIHFVPNPSDCGLSTGAALYVSNNFGKSSFSGNQVYFSPYLGSEIFDKDELFSLKKEYPNKTFYEDQISCILAQLIAKDFIVGVIRGRYEIGPRALGNRSILCNPLNKNMREIINNKVKKREWYRPFAPVVTAEDSQKFFTNSTDIPYMSVICFTRPEYVNLLPSVTHIDGSARVQTIRKEQNPFLYETLKAFEKVKGFPILLNTSFNPKGEPILNFARVGLQMLKETDLDFVLIENTIFCKSENEDFFNNFPLNC